MILFLLKNQRSNKLNYYFFFFGSETGFEVVAVSVKNYSKLFPVGFPVYRGLELKKSPKASKSSFFFGFDVCVKLFPQISSIFAFLTSLFGF